MTWEWEKKKTMPPLIKKNFIYRVIFDYIWCYDMGAVFLFIGGVGNGKSTAALRFASDIDRNFSVERVAFSVDEALKLIKNGDSKGKLKPGSAIVFDEIAGSEEGADSRDSLSTTNKLLSYFVTTSRSQRLLIIYCCPLMSQIDKRVRSIGVTGVLNFDRKVDLKLKESKPVLYWSYTSSLTGFNYIPKPRLNVKNNLYTCERIGVGLPDDRSLVKDYKKKKDGFFYDNVGRWDKTIEERKRKKELKKGRTDLKKLAVLVTKNRERYETNGKLDTAKIAIDFEVGQSSSGYIKRVVESGFVRA